MTVEEIEKELAAIEMYERTIDNVNVTTLLNKEIDTSFLEALQCTITPNGQLFRIDNQGFLPSMLEEMYEDRKKYKRMMLDAKQEYENEKDVNNRHEIEKRIARYHNLERAKKLSLNSCYGALGSKYFRLYDIRLALAVTTAGQLSIKWIDKTLNTYMQSVLKTDRQYVIYCDTDSIYLSMEELVKRYFKTGDDIQSIIKFMDKVCEQKIQPVINKSYDDLSKYAHTYAQKMVMKRECLADKGIWIAKKRYILNVYNNEGVSYKEPKLKVMGLEMVKSSTPYVVRSKMKELIKLIVNSDEHAVQKYIADFKSEFSKLEPEDVSFPRGVNGLSEYTDNYAIYKKGTPIHVKGALIYNHLLDKMSLSNTYEHIREGEKLKFVYLKTPNPIRQSVISYPIRLPKEFKLHDYVDYNTQFDKTFLAPIKIILDCIGWRSEKLNTLESFFA